MNANVKRTAAAVVTAAALGTALGSAPAASAGAVGDVRIVEFGFNAVGTDTAANRNSEFVRIKNTTAGTLAVEGWVLHDAYQNSAGDWGNRFTFQGSALPAGSPFKDADGRFQIPAGAEVYVYQGSGVDSTPTSNTASVYRNGKHIWNNAGDTIYVRTSKDAPSYVARVIYTGYRVKISQ